MTSAELENVTGCSSHTIRRDISYLGGDFSSGAGYGIAPLLKAIETALGLDRRRKCCIVGLGRLGSALLNFSGFVEEGFDLVAGFDSSVNRVEILSSTVPLYPNYKLSEVVGRFGIEIALLCVPANAAQAAAEKLINARIKGIVNFAPTALVVPAGISVQDVYVVDDLRALAAKLSSVESQK
jgi:redox-sensing transcriptional repressor